MEVVRKIFVFVSIGIVVVVQGKYLECDEMKRHQLAENCTLTNLHDILDLRSPLHIHSHVARRVKHIICLNSNPNYFPFVAFQTFPRVEKFTAKNCHIRALVEHPFSKASYLRELQMSHNHLQHLVENSFWGAKHLEVVNLAYNRIFSIHHNVFSHLRYLSHLDVQHNQLQNLNLMLHVGQPMDLIASHNSITAFSIQHGKYLPRDMSLQVDVRHNRISRLNIPSNSPLKQMLLEYNNVRNVSSVIRIKRLSVFSILYNPIFSEDFSRETYTRRTKVPNKLFVQTKNDGIKPLPASPSNCTALFEREYCLNGGVCFNFVIDGVITLLMCECSHGYFGERCEEKFLEGSYHSHRVRLRYYG